MCFVRRSTAGFIVKNIAAWLSEHSGIGPSIGNPISPLKDLSQAACRPVLASSIYSASPTDNATVFCRWDAQDIVQKPLDKPVWCRMASAPLTMVCWNLSARPFCCGESGMDVWVSILFSIIYDFCSFDRNSPPRSKRLHFNVVPSCLSAQALYCLNAANSSFYFLR